MSVIKVNFIFTINYYYFVLLIMGVAFFFKHFKTLFPETLLSNPENDHDILVLELNGILYKNIKHFYCDKLIKDPTFDNTELFELICNDIFNLIKKYPPKHSVFLAMDGYASMMKYQEQLNRRYKNIISNIYENLFDLNQLTPGTQFLCFCTKYIDWFIRKKMNENEMFRNITIYFSNEKHRGEGEYKALRFLRRIENLNKKVLILSKDADWINLSLLLPANQNIVISRDDETFISIPRFKEDLTKFNFDHETLNSFFIDIYVIFLLLGNDYLNTFQFFHNLEQVYSSFLPIYKECRLRFVDEKNNININNLVLFLKHCCSSDSVSNHVDVVVSSHKKQKVEDFFYLLQNIVLMNTNHIFDWNFMYSFTTPSFDEIKNYIRLYNIPIIKKIEKKKPSKEECLYRLFILLPYRSRYLLPQALEKFPRDNYPTNLSYDLINRKFCFSDYQKSLDQFDRFYMENKVYFKKEEKKRNTEGKLFEYKFHTERNTFLKSYYGNLKKNSVVMKRITE